MNNGSIGCSSDPEKYNTSKDNKSHAFRTSVKLMTKRVYMIEKFHFYIHVIGKQAYPSTNHYINTENIYN